MLPPIAPQTRLLPPSSTPPPRRRRARSCVRSCGRRGAATLPRGPRCPPAIPTTRRTRRMIPRAPPPPPPSWSSAPAPPCRAPAARVRGPEERPVPTDPTGPDQRVIRVCSRPRVRGIVGPFRISKKGSGPGGAAIYMAEAGSGERKKRKVVFEGVLRKFCPPYFP